MHWAVGDHMANPFGLQDVHGNVWEWCLDRYCNDAYENSQSKDPVWDDSLSIGYVARGGSFRSLADGTHSAQRSYFRRAFSGTGGIVARESCHGVVPRNRGSRIVAVRCWVLP